MKNSLSIRAAAQQYPNACALIVGQAHYTFAELAELVQTTALSEPNIHRATSPFLSALRLYASLETRRCIAFVDRDTPEESLTAMQKRLPRQTDEKLALIVFTSGSTGLPKGVQLSRDALIASANASRQRLGWQGDDRWLCVLPLSHIGGLSILIRCLVARKTVVLCDGFDAQTVSDIIISDRITHASFVPTMLWRLLKLGFCAPTHLQVTLMGGASIDSNLVKRAKEAGFTLQLSYGLTESASMILTDGLALSGVELRVQDGRLQIKSPTLMNAYLPPHDSVTSIVDGWLDTEDLATIDESGRVRILGREDEVIISGGENIDPRAIENALLSSDQIDSAHALGLSHDEWGQILVALVVLSPSYPTTIDWRHIPLRGAQKPKMLIIVEKLPLLPNGKIDRKRAYTVAIAQQSQQ